MTTKEALHRLIDDLPEDALPAVERYLASVRDDPVVKALVTAPIDDEPTTPEEDASSEEAWQSYRRGQYVSNEDLRRDIGW
jgi:hypothetical protein